MRRITGRNEVGAILRRGRQGPDELTDDHQHRRCMVARLDRNGAGLRCIVDHSGKLENGVECIVARHDAAIRGRLREAPVRRDGHQVLHHRVEPALGPAILLCTGITLAV
jgi:hypothetical protein